MSAENAHPQGFDHWIIQLITSHYTDYARRLGRGKIKFTMKESGMKFHVHKQD
jgi:hypothetical protein